MHSSCKLFVCTFRYQLALFIAFVLGLIFGLFSDSFQNRYFVSFEYPSPASKIRPFDSKDSGRHRDAVTVVADNLAKRVRVFCMILTSPANHDTKAVAVRDTWASRCNAHIFASSVANDSLPSLVAVKEEGRQHLWSKTQFLVHHAAMHFGNDYDFFLKADDDTFVIVENLRKLLSTYSWNTSFIMGRRFRPYVKQGYLSGGGGYVMSRSALFRIHDGLSNNPKCAEVPASGAEDVNLATCAQIVGVKVLDSLNDLGLEHFHPFTPRDMLSSSVLRSISWFIAYDYHNSTFNAPCCSDYAVTFHYVDYRDMYVYHYFLYHLHAYGIHRDVEDLGAMLSMYKCDTVNLSNNTSVHNSVI